MFSQCALFSQDAEVVHDDPDRNQDQDGPASYHQANTEQGDSKCHPLGITGVFIQAICDRFSQRRDVKNMERVNKSSKTQQI